MNTVEFPGVKLSVLGVKITTGKSVLLGTVPLHDPEERTATSNTILRGIEAARSADQMATMANLLFDPKAFDYFVVE